MRTGFMEIVSGLWHQVQCMLHPWKKTVDLIPGPSFRENLWIFVMRACFTSTSFDND